MDSVCVGGKANVNTIIDDQRGARLCASTPGNATQLARAAKKSPWLLGLRLVAKLDQRRASGDQFFRIADDGHNRVWLRREAGEVDDGIKVSERHYASLRWPSYFTVYSQQEEWARYNAFG